MHWEEKSTRDREMKEQPQNQRMTSSLLIPLRMQPHRGGRINDKVSLFRYREFLVHFHILHSAHSIIVPMGFNVHRRSFVYVSWHLIC